MNKPLRCPHIPPKLLGSENKVVTQCPAVVVMGDVEKSIQTLEEAVDLLLVKVEALTKKEQVGE